MKTATKISVGLAISALTLYLFLRTIDPAKVATSLAHASWPLLAASIAIGYFGHLSLRARRWGTMLEPLRARVSFYNLFSTTAIGYAISWLTPGRIGEVVRPVLLAGRESIPVAGVLATAVIERMLDVVAIVVLAAFAAMTAPMWWQTAGRTELLRTVSWMGAALLVASIAGLLLLRALVQENSRFLRLVDRRRSGGGRLAKFWNIVRHGAEGASFLRSSRRALRVGVESLSIWVVVAFGCWIGLLAARVKIPFPGSFLLVAVSAVGISVPTPGGAGPVHFAFQRGLIDLFGVEPNLASAATVLYHPISIYIPPILIGLVFAWRDGLSLAKVRTLRADE